MIKSYKSDFLIHTKLSNHDNRKLILLLQKSVYPYECMDDWKRFDETSLPEKEDFHCHLNMEDITDADYVHSKRVCKDFELKNLGKYHDLYVQSDTLLLAHVFENIKICVLKYMSLILKIFLSSWVSIASSFKQL